MILILEFINVLWWEDSEKSLVKLRELCLERGFRENRVYEN